jgi:hypothetical protein
MVAVKFCESRTERVRVGGLTKTTRLTDTVAVELFVGSCTLVAATW